MPPTTTVTDVIITISKLAGAIAAFTSVLSMGVTEFVKKFTQNSKLIAVFAAVFGFVAAGAIMKLMGYNWFSALSLLVSVTAAIGGPGVYTISTTLLSKQDNS